MAKANHTCIADGCERAQYAKQMCSMHYKRTVPRTPDKPVTRTCVVCGVAVIRAARANFKIGATCSKECWHALTWGQRCEIPADHPARWYGTTSAWKPPATEPARFISGYCTDCDAPFLIGRNGDPGAYCSPRCSARVGRRRRRAREHQAQGEYRYSEIMRQYRKQGMACAYCKRPCAGLPDPEHVLPLSRGGRNDMTNLVAACRPCNTDKNDLTLAEWAIDRERRGLAALDVTLEGDAYRNVVTREPISAAWRHQTVA